MLPEPCEDALAEHERRVAARPLPAHIGIIMDGNGRWARARSQARLEGHRRGSDAVREITRCARRIGIKALTLYAFSSQNWARPAREVAGLMALLADFLESERSEILDNQIRLNAIGELDRLPRLVRTPLDALRRASSRHQGMVLTLALSYGGREEIVSMARKIADGVAEGRLSPGEVDETLVAGLLWTSDLPCLDLVVRTSGEHRLSNFLLWQSAYAELVFVDKQWPDFHASDLLGAIATFQGRDRRFGLTEQEPLRHAAR